MTKVVDDLGDAYDELVALQAEAHVSGLENECLAHGQGNYYDLLQPSSLT